MKIVKDGLTAKQTSRTEKDGLEAELKEEVRILPRTSIKENRDILVQWFRESALGAAAYT